MKYNNPKRINFEVSEISFGGWQLGNQIDYDFSDEDEAINLVKAAIDAGITLFDTAPNYGLGNSERILGKAIRGLRNRVFINTKFGHDEHDNQNFDVSRLNRSLIDSLNRLNTDYVDSIILHNPSKEMLDQRHPIYLELNRLKNLGLIHHFGVSIDTVSELEFLLENNDVDVIELMFNVIHQSPKIWFDEIEKRGILLMIKVPLDSGWLSGKYNKSTRFNGIRTRWSKEVINTRLKIVEKIKAIVGEDILHASLRFILNFSAVTCVIPGTRTLKHLETNIMTSEHGLTKDKQKALETLYEDEIKHLFTPW